MVTLYFKMLVPNFYVPLSCKKAFLLRGLHIYYDPHLKVKSFL
jgi:hypothetical protein